MNEEAIRRDERHRMADLLEAEVETFVQYAADGPKLVRLIALMMRLEGDPQVLGAGRG